MHSEIVDPNLLPEPTPQSYLEGARSYKKGVDMLLADPLETPIDALGLLAAHSTELALKALLLSGGMSHSELIKANIRHNLKLLWAAAAKLDLLTEQAPPFWCDVLAIAHDRPFHFRYMRPGWGVAVPEPKDLQEGLRSLLDEIELKLSM